MTVKPLILMTDPAWFDVAYEINPWMQPAAWRADAESNARAARAAFETLRATLTTAGAEVRVIEGAPGLADMVFPANAAVVLNRRGLLGRFRPKERRGEEDRFAAAFETLRREGVVDEVARLPAGLFQEGAGDCIWDTARGHFWAGWGQRSSRAAADAVAEFFGREVIPLELADPRFYHLDTCFCPPWRRDPLLSARLHAGRPLRDPQSGAVRPADRRQRRGRSLALGQCGRGRPHRRHGGSDRGAEARAGAPRLSRRRRRPRPIHPFRRRGLLHDAAPEPRRRTGSRLDRLGAPS